MSRDDAKVQVLTSTDIVRLIGEHVALTPRGREYLGLCPFHDDKNPSMHVSPAKQIYKCFSCGAGGDAFSFVMGYHKMTFPEALKFLAEKAGIKLPKFSGGSSDSGEASPRQLIGKANSLAVEFFRSQLRDERIGKLARDYVHKRQISPQMVEAFRIGYAPDGWDGLVTHIRQHKLDRKGFELGGLISPRQSGDGFYDRLRHRLIFPIYDEMDRPIAFGGRKLREEDEPKYLNSPETPLFNKSATLFGLNLAKQTIAKTRTAIITEGYTDVIACHQYGVTNAVATLGTALTPQHATVLRRFCDKVILLFDGDEAGQKAADRALKVFFQEPIDIAIAILPDELDPADLLAKDDGLSRWNQCMAEAVDAMTFQFNRVRAEFDASDTLAGKQRVADGYLRTLIDLGFDNLDASRRGLVIARLAQMLHTDEKAMDAQVRKLVAASRPRPQLSAPANGQTAAQPSAHQRPTRLNAPQQAERHIIGCLLTRPAYFHAQMPDGRDFSESIVPSDFSDEFFRELYHHVFEWLLEHEDITPADFRDVARDDERILGGLLEAQMEADRLTDNVEAKIAELLGHCAKAVIDRRAEMEYQLQKMNLRANVEVDADELKRLEMAVSHLKANPSARRMPRVG